MSIENFEASKEKWKIGIQRMGEYEDHELVEWFVHDLLGSCGFCYEFDPGNVGCGNCPLHPEHCGVNKEDNEEATFWQIGKAAEREDRAECVRLCNVMQDAIISHKDKFKED